MEFREGTASTMPQWRLQAEGLGSVVALLERHWNRFYLDDKSNFSREPNTLLVQFLQGKRSTWRVWAGLYRGLIRPTGAALDYAMGAGRNAARSDSI